MTSSSEEPSQYSIMIHRRSVCSNEPRNCTMYRMSHSLRYCISRSRSPLSSSIGTTFTATIWLSTWCSALKTLPNDLQQQARRCGRARASALCTGQQWWRAAKHDCYPSPSISSNVRNGMLGESSGSSGDVAGIAPSRKPSLFIGRLHGSERYLPPRAHHHRGVQGAEREAGRGGSNNSTCTCTCTCTLGSTPGFLFGARILQPHFSGKILLPIKNENALDSRNQLAEISSNLQ